jgi:hypothetical protein
MSSNEHECIRLNSFVNNQAERQVFVPAALAGATSTANRVVAADAQENVAPFCATRQKQAKAP